MGDDRLYMDSDAPWNLGARVSPAVYVEEMMVALQMRWASDTAKAHWAHQVKGLQTVVRVVRHAGLDAGACIGADAPLPPDRWVSGTAPADMVGCGPELRAWLLALQSTVEACALPIPGPSMAACGSHTHDGLLEAALEAVPVAFGQDVMMVMLATLARIKEDKVMGVWCPLSNWLAVRTMLFWLAQRWHASPAPVEVMVICLTSVLDALHRTQLPSDPLVAGQVQGVFLPLTLGLRVFFKRVPDAPTELLPSASASASASRTTPRPQKTKCRSCGCAGLKRKAAGRCDHRHGGSGGGIRVVDSIFPTASSVDLGKEHVRSLMQRVANRWLRQYPTLQAVVLDLYRECGLLAQGLPPVAMSHPEDGAGAASGAYPAWVPRFWGALTAPGAAEAAERQWRLQIVTWLQLLMQVYGDVGVLEGMVIPDNMPRCGGRGSHQRLLLGDMDMTAVFALTDLLVKAVHSYVLLTGREVFPGSSTPAEARVLVPPLVALAEIVLRGHMALHEGDGDGDGDGADQESRPRPRPRHPVLVFPGVLLDHLEGAVAGGGVLQTARVPGSDLQEHWDTYQCRASSWLCNVYNFLMVAVQVRRHSDAFATSLWPGPVYAAMNKLAVMFVYDARLANLVTALVCPEADTTQLARDDHWSCVGHPVYRRVEQYSGCLLAMLAWQCEVAELLESLGGGDGSDARPPGGGAAVAVGREQLAVLQARSGQLTRWLLGAMCDLVAYLSPLIRAQETVFVAHCFRTVRSCAGPEHAVDMLRAVAVILDAVDPPRGTALYTHVLSGLVTLCSHWVVRQWEHSVIPAFILWRLAGDGTVVDFVQAHLEPQATHAADRGLCRLGCRARGSCHPVVHDPQLHAAVAEACFVPVKPLVVQAHVWATLALCADPGATASSASWRNGVVFALNDLVVAARRMLPRSPPSLSCTSLSTVQAWDTVMAQCAACVIACPQAAFLVDLLCRPVARSDVWMFIDPVMAAVEGKLPQVLGHCLALEQEVLAHMPPKGPWAALLLQPPRMTVAYVAVTVAGSLLAAVLVWAKSFRTQADRVSRTAVVLPLFVQAVRSVRVRVLHADTLVELATFLRGGVGLLQHAAKTLPECVLALLHALAMECGVLHGAVRRETRAGVCANDGWGPCAPDTDAAAVFDACSPPWPWVGLCMDAVCALCLDGAAGQPVLLRGALPHDDLLQDVFLPMVDLLANGGNLWSAPLVLRVCAALVHPEIVEMVAPLGGSTIAALLHVGAPAFAHPHPDAQALLRAVVDVYA
jgi:hypothetical protein